MCSVFYFQYLCDNISVTNATSESLSKHFKFDYYYTNSEFI